jgi:CRISPR-associated endonuclease Csn1
MLQKLTTAAKEAERKGLPKGFDSKLVDQPAAGFSDAVRATVEDVFVSRADRHRARGEAHAATIKRVAFVDGVETVFERKAVADLTLKDLKRIPIPAPYGKIADPMKLRDAMVSELQRWIENGKPKDQLPRSQKGDLIAKVRIRTDDKVAVLIRGGTAGRGEMARVDVFGMANKRGRLEYYIVPIYPHQTTNREQYPMPPDGYIVQGKPEMNIGPNHAFLFSLYSHSLLEVVKSDGVVIRGYFKGLDRATGNISIAESKNIRNVTRSIGPRTLERFIKLNVDRLGNVTEVMNEVRTWHGVACT